MNTASKSRFNTVGLAVKTGDPRALEVLDMALGQLQKNEHRFIADERTAADLVTDVEIGDITTADIVLVVGGDGTMLHTARQLADPGVPLVGINAGRLGFLADITPAQMKESLNAVFAGNYIEEPRAVLQVEVHQGDKVIWSGPALNDAVVQKRDVGRMIDFETHINNSYVCSHRADGVVIATPTGSTAYALSAGGPILHPGMEAIAIVPICPHTLSDRPLVINGDARIDIVMRDSESAHAQVVLDGQEHRELGPGTRVIIRKHVKPVRLLHPEGHDYYHVLRDKLHWGRDQASGRER
ncbi:MAG: NAD(+) kinase [Gammaproteobacteria bacterium]|nr:NAD(+) kinase [Gammaproteobacteria bacterium]